MTGEDWEQPGKNGEARERLLPVSAERVAAEQRRARENETAELEVERTRRRMMWQCVALSFAGVPFYALSWRFATDRTADVFAAAGFFVSYALPFFRWLSHHIRTSDAFET